MILLRKIFLLFISLFFLIGCDLTIKKLAETELKGKAPQTYLDGKVTLLYAENSGGMLSIGEELSREFKFIIFRVGIGILLFLLFLYLIIKDDIRKLEYIAFVLFLSGGLGNLIDRLLNNGHVVDFMVLEFVGLRTGVFNLADVYIMTGAGVIILSRLLTRGTREVAL